MATLKNVKKIWNGNLFVEVKRQRQVENILKMKTFHTTKRKAYLHEKLNTSKGVIRSRELALANGRRDAGSPGKIGFTNIKRIIIRKGEEKIETNTYILTFNQTHILKEVNIGYCVERVEQYVPAPLRCFKCQKYGHHREACRGWHTCAKCGEMEPDHMEEDCLKEMRCVNCRQNHLAYARFCEAYKKRKRDTWNETQEDYVFPGSKENSRYLHRQNHLCLCCTEGEYNQSR